MNESPFPVAKARKLLVTSVSTTNESADILKEMRPFQQANECQSVHSASLQSNAISMFVLCSFIVQYLYIYILSYNTDIRKLSIDCMTQVLEGCCCRITIFGDAVLLSCIDQLRFLKGKAAELCMYIYFKYRQQKIKRRLHDSFPSLHKPLSSLPSQAEGACDLNTNML